MNMKLSGLAGVLLAPLAALALLAGVASAQAADAKKPNILVIFGEERTKLISKERDL